ncbi:MULTISPECIES: helix-turn-helix transcriptional regulator [unclassified Herbaspirillum]|uniref:AraC family transcriptional regulator n=1 Tax=unclassified Herbaspirillum TaxID=2624150 RepID=UPI000E2F48F2|nr:MULTISPECIES: helix-turn-helix transcriptional regulator [unclassified Herbaspirillum]RFB69701.1 AraC family transcriptional regulator [Herbaspirillum sp. 3R-3a1]TFI07235.1 AraC family transcriptional regulator [Herbaspirillum sp. 3R11]TFI13173.1 AraC family transcriptional regulator [Herbaspirillum sp. 3R-11]TFI28799.1 AraC family transcriptional regulator [Herbaspirillum sp. 3C11]TFI28820.1 AraC family transcriptional regulator [Herbaspirillum sp. 3C11]
MVHTVHSSPKAAQLQHLPHAVVAFSRDFDHDQLLATHSHPRGQLLYAAEGVMQVRTAHGLWVIPPQRALWVPCSLAHEIRMLSAVRLRTLYIRPHESELIGVECRLLEVSALLRELILALLQEESDYDTRARGGHLAQLILSEIDGAAAIPVVIPWPADRRVVAVCEAILADPGNANSLEHWAEFAGASPRTLIRLFPKETGLHFRHWVQQVHITDALLRLSQGEAVERIAERLGYKSASAFTSMFRSVLGKTPSQYGGLARRNVAADSMLQRAKETG